MKVTFAAKRHSEHDNGNGSNGGYSDDEGCGGTADAGVILSVIIHMYKNKNTQNKPGGDDNDSAESSA